MRVRMCSLLLLVSALAAAAPSLAAGCPGTVQWDGEAGTTAWETDLNWSTNAVPGASDDVCIPDLAPGIEVVHSTGTHAVRSLAGAGGLQLAGGTLSFAVDSPGLGQLTVSGGTLSGTGDLPIETAFGWTAGTLTGSGTTAVTGAVLAGNSAKILSGGRTLQTSGTTTWTGPGEIRLGTGGLLHNAGVWDVQDDATITNLGGAGGFQNPSGSILRKLAKDGATSVGVPFTNGGTVSLQSGVLSFEGGSSTTGTFQGIAGTTLQFAGGAHTLAAGSSLAAATVLCSTGSLTVEGSFSATSTSFIDAAVTFEPDATVVQMGPLVISNSAVDLSSGGAITVLRLSLLGGTLSGTDTLSATQSQGSTWTAGTITGPGTTILNGGVLSGSAPKDLSQGRVLRNTGSLEWYGSGAIRLASGAVLENHSSWSVEDTGSIVDLGGAGGFHNQGLFRQNSSGETVVQVPFTNDDRVIVEFGTLSLEGGGSAAGRFEHASFWDFDTLRFNGGTFALGPSSLVNSTRVAVTAGTVTVDGTYIVPITTVSGGALVFQPAASFPGFGEVFLSGTGLLKLDSGEAVNANRLSMTGGSLAGSDTGTVSGPFTWNSGVLTGAGSVTANQGVAFGGGAATDLTGGKTLRTLGTTSWAGTASIRVGGAATIENHGEWALLDDASLLDLGGAGTFTNLPGALFRKVDGVTVSEVNVPFVNAGTVEAGAATLHFAGGFTQTGGETRLDGGSLSATTPVSIQGGSLLGVGNVAASVASSGTVLPGLSAGSLAIGGAYAQSTAGTLAIEIGGLTPGTLHDVLEVTGATSLSGTLEVSLIDGFVPQSGDTFTILTASACSGSFSALQLPALPAGLAWSVRMDPTEVVLEVSGDLDGDGVGDAGDCAPADPTAGYLPAEVAGVGFAGDKQTLSWISQAPLGGISTAYDVVRGFVEELPAGGPGEICLQSGGGTASLADPTEPAAGEVFYYLVRAKNTCSVGTYGSRSDGTPRTTAACP